jgi:hypothetical protein
MVRLIGVCCKPGFDPPLVPTPCKGAALPAMLSVLRAGR